MTIVFTPTQPLALATDYTVTFAAERLPLVPGTHVIEAEAQGERRAFRITVAGPPATR